MLGNRVKDQVSSVKDLSFSLMEKLHELPKFVNGKPKSPFKPVNFCLSPRKNYRPDWNGIIYSAGEHISSCSFKNKRLVTVQILERIKSILIRTSFTLAKLTPLLIISSTMNSPCITPTHVQQSTVLRGISS